MAMKKGTLLNSFRIPKNVNELSDRDRDILSMGPVEVAKKYKIKPQAVSARKNSLRKVFGKDFTLDRIDQNTGETSLLEFEPAEGHSEAPEGEEEMVDLQPISATSQLGTTPSIQPTKTEPMKRNYNNSNRKQQPLPPELTRTMAPRKIQPQQQSSQPKQQQMPQAKQQAAPEPAVQNTTVTDSNVYALHLTFGNVSMKFREVPPKISVDEANNAVSFV